MVYNLYLDDSGNLHVNSGNKYFFYGGLLVKESNKNKLKNNYRKRVRSILDNNTSYGDEIKGFNVKNRHRKHLLENLKTNNTQVFIAIDQEQCPDLDRKSKKDIVRFKNYTIKYMIVGLFIKGYLNECSELRVIMDNQNIAVSAKNSLEDYLHNCINYEKYFQKDTKTREFLVDKKITITVEYCDSKQNYLVQAADLLVNTMWKYYEKGIDFTEYIQKNAVFVDFSNGKHNS